MNHAPLNRYSKWHVLGVMFATLAATLTFQNCGPSMSSEELDSTPIRTTGRDPSTISAEGGGGNYFSNDGSGTTSTGGAPPFSGPGGGSSSSGSMGGGGTFSNGSGSSGTPTGLQFAYMSRDMSITEGATAYFSAFVVASQPTQLRYQWYKDGQALAGMTSPNLEIRSVKADNQGLFHVIVTDGNHTIKSADARLTVNPARNPCAKGYYGRTPTSGNTTEFFHESTFGGLPAYRRFFVPATNDAYINVLNCRSILGFSHPSGGTITLQCQNGKQVLIADNCIYPEPG